MDNICLEDAKIKFEGAWLSADDLARIIRYKIKTGNLQFAKVASALEKLNRALKNTCTIEGVKLVLSKEELDSKL